VVVSLYHDVCVHLTEVTAWIWMIADVRAVIALILLLVLLIVVLRRSYSKKKSKKGTTSTGDDDDEATDTGDGNTTTGGRRNSSSSHSRRGKLRSVQEDAEVDEKYTDPPMQQQQIQVGVVCHCLQCEHGC